MPQLSKREQEARDSAERLLDELNDMGFDRNHFADKVVHSHRSLQQNLFRLFMDCVERWAECERRSYFDIRNRHTVKMCKKILDIDGILLIPHV
jgi:hypothetical protein